MVPQLITDTDISYLSQQQSFELDIILGQMTTLVQEISNVKQDTDYKVEQLNNQNWFQRMCNTLLGKNKVTRDEIRKNNDKVVTYISQSVARLYDMNLISMNILCSLGNRMNDIYLQVTAMNNELLNTKNQISDMMIIQEQTLTKMQAFVSKLNEKIESVDNFHMLTEEIDSGIYNDKSRLYSLCMILSQLDRRQMNDQRKMAILIKKMRDKGIITDESITVLQCLQDIITLPQQKVGLIYMELCNFRNSFPANIFSDMIESYHFLTDIERISKKKEILIQRLIDIYELDAYASFPFSFISTSFFDNKNNCYLRNNDLKQIENKHSNESEHLSDDQIEKRFNSLYNSKQYSLAVNFAESYAEKGNPVAQFCLGWCYEKGNGVLQNNDEALKWYKKAANQGDDNAKQRANLIRKKIDQ